MYNYYVIIIIIIIIIILMLLRHMHVVYTQCHTYIGSSIIDFL